jgi:hypothetical protein
MINYDGRKFRASHGEDGEAATAVYHQDGDLLWGEFSGGDTRRGSLTGVCAEDGSLEFAYTMVSRDGEVICGHCRSTPEALADGRIRLHETFERYGPHAVRGTSHIDEI